MTKRYWPARAMGALLRQYLHRRRPAPVAVLAIHLPPHPVVLTDAVADVMGCKFGPQGMYKNETLFSQIYEGERQVVLDRGRGLVGGCDRPRHRHLRLHPFQRGQDAAHGPARRCDMGTPAR